jgi:hypothetical protein
MPNPVQRMHAHALSVFQKTLYIVSYQMVRLISFGSAQAHSLDRHSHLAYVHFA